MVKEGRSEREEGEWTWEGGKGRARWMCGAWWGVAVTGTGGGRRALRPSFDRVRWEAMEVLSSGVTGSGDLLVHTCTLYIHLASTLGCDK